MPQIGLKILALELVHKLVKFRGYYFSLLFPSTMGPCVPGVAAASSPAVPLAALGRARGRSLAGRGTRQRGQ